MFKFVKDEKGNLCPMIIRIADTAFIPFDPANTDYQQYLAWLAEGNIPLPADEQGAQQ